MHILLNNTKFKYRLSLLVIAICSIVQNNLIAQPSFKFKHITPTEGLMNTYIQKIHEDSYGYLWFGSENGLFRYDGFEFLNHFENPNDPNAISGTYLRDIVEDKNGDLWVATNKGLNFYKRELRAFSSLQHEADNPQSLQSNNIFSIEIDSSGNLWIASNNEGLSYYNTQTKKFLFFRHQADDYKSLSNNRLYATHLDKQQRLWIGTEEGEIDLLLSGTSDFIHLKLINKQTNKAARHQVRRIIEGPKGNIWIATSGSGLFKVDFKDSINYEVTNYLNDPNDPYSLSINSLSSMAFDDKGNLAIGTENGGLNYFNIRDNRFYNQMPDDRSPTSLSDHSIWDVYYDKDYNLWVSSITKGIDVQLNQDYNFKHYYHQPSNDNSLRHNTVSCFYKDSEGLIWIGTDGGIDGGGLSVYDEEKDLFTNYTTQNSGLSSNAILAILEDSFGEVWVGTYEGGINVFDRKMGRFRQLNSSNSKLSCDNVISLFEDEDSVMWAGTFWCNGGVNKFNRETQEFTALTAEDNGLCDNVVFTLHKDSKKRFWVGMLSGLSYLDSNSSSFKCLPSIPDDTTSLSHGTVLDILEYDDSTLWIGTINGLNKYNYITNTFMRYDVSDGLPDNYISGLEKDAEGNIWIGTHGGLCKFNPFTETYTNYKSVHGLQGEFFYRCSHYQSADGTMFFGGVNGFNMFNPSEIKSINQKPSMFLSDFELFNRFVDIGPKSVLKKDIAFIDTIYLKHNQNSFTLHFSAINFRTPNETLFEYKLEGFDKQWIRSGVKDVATYTNIDPGTYRFTARIPHKSGIHNEKGVNIYVVISTPFWQTWWFKVLIVSFIGVLFSGFYTIRLKSIKRINIQLEKTVEQRTRELKLKNEELEGQSVYLNDANVILEEIQQQTEEQACKLLRQQKELELKNKKYEELLATKDKFFSIIAHDIKNPFNILLGYTEVLSINYDRWDKEKRKNIIQILNSNTKRAYELLENLLEWSRSQRGVIEFRPLTIRVDSLIESTFKLLNDQAKHKGINLSYSNPNAIDEVVVDENMLKTILRNLINNALKFTDKEGDVQLIVRKVGEEIIFEVVDNGVGMDCEAVGNLFSVGSNNSTLGTNSEKGTGLGLILVKEFVEHHKGRITVSSKLGDGSSFKLHIPDLGYLLDKEDSLIN